VTGLNADDRRILADAYLAAWIEGLERHPLSVAVRPAGRVPLDDTGRAPVVPLRPTGGDRA